MALVRWYYPAFYRLAKRLHSFLVRHQKDMVQINNITGTELTQLEGLYTALDGIVRSDAWPKYIERA